MKYLLAPPSPRFVVLDMVFNWLAPDSSSLPRRFLFEALLSSVWLFLFLWVKFLNLFLKDL